MKKRLVKGVVLGLVCSSVVGGTCFATNYTSQQQHFSATHVYNSGDVFSMYEGKLPNIEINGTGSDITLNNVGAYSYDRTYASNLTNPVGNVWVFGDGNKLTIADSTLQSANYGINARGIALTGETDPVTGVPKVDGTTGNHTVDISNTAITVQPWWTDYMNADGSYQYAPQGAVGVGIYSSGNDVTLRDNTTITMAANYSAGLYISPTIFNNQGTVKDNVVNLNKTGIGTWGYYAPGINITGAGNVVNSNMSSSVTHVQYSPAVITTGNAIFNADNESYFETQKNMSPGVLVFNHGQATVKNSTIITAGDYSPTVLASTAPNGATTDTTVDNKATLENTKLTTAGAYSPGLLGYGYKSAADNAYHGSKIEANNVEINTTGNWAPAVFAGNNYDLNSGSVVTGALPGVDDANNTVVTVDGAKIKTTGTDSSAVTAFLNGKAVVSNADILATGEHSAGVLVEEGGKVVLNNSTVASTQTAVVNTHTNGIVEANNSTITGYIKHEQEQSLRGLEVNFSGLTELGAALGALGQGANVTGGVDGTTILPSGYTDNLTIGNFDVTLNNTQWNMTADSDLGIGTFKADNSTVDMTVSGRGNYETLNLDKMSGQNSNYIYDTDLASETYGDKIYVKNTGSDAGVNYIQVYDKSLTTGERVEAKDNGIKTKLLVVGGDGAGYTNWAGKTLDTGGLWETTPTVEKLEDNQWYLTLMRKAANPNTESLIGAMDSLYGMWRYDDTLRKRLGDLRYVDPEQYGLWVRMKAGKMGAPRFDGSYQMYQLGYDKKDNNTIYGVAIDHTRAKNSYVAGRGENAMNSLTLYATNYRGGVEVKNEKSGATYSDLVLRASKLRGDLDSSAAYNDHVEFDTWGYNLSYELGKTYRNDKGWFLEPQSQLSLGYLRGGDYVTNHGTSVSREGNTSVLGRLGFVLGRKIHDNSDYYFKANIYREFKGDGDMRFALGDQKMTYGSHNKDTWYELGIGGNVRLANNTYFYGDVLKTFGADIQKKWQVNVGLRWTWGGPKKSKAVPVVQPAEPTLVAPIKETYLDSVHFDFDVDTPIAGEMYKIDHFAEVAKENPDKKYAVVGNTDAIGTDDYNMDLSKRRADNVKAEAAKRGVAMEQMQEEYLGKAKPVESNETASGRAANRRVEIYEHEKIK